jgi:hypothetical protein
LHEWFVYIYPSASDNCAPINIILRFHNWLINPFPFLQ